MNQNSSKLMHLKNQQNLTLLQHEYLYFRSAKVNLYSNDHKWRKTQLIIKKLEELSDREARRVKIDVYELSSRI